MENAICKLCDDINHKEFAKEEIINVDELKLPSFIKQQPVDYGYDVIKYIKVKKANLKTKNKIDIEILGLIFDKKILSEIFNSLTKFNEEILNEIALKDKQKELSMN